MRLARLGVGDDGAPGAAAPGADAVAAADGQVVQVFAEDTAVTRTGADLAISVAATLLDVGDANDADLIAVLVRDGQGRASRPGVRTLSRRGRPEAPDPV